MKQQSNNAAITYRTMKEISKANLDTGILPIDMKVFQLKILLLPLNTKDIGDIPTYKKDMSAVYDPWKYRVS